MPPPQQFEEPAVTQADVKAAEKQQSRIKVKAVQSPHICHLPGLGGCCCCGPHRQGSSGQSEPCLLHQGGEGWLWSCSAESLVALMPSTGKQKRTHLACQISAPLGALKHAGRDALWWFQDCGQVLAPPDLYCCIHVLLCHG